MQVYRQYARNTDRQALPIDPWLLQRILCSNPFGVLVGETLSINIDAHGILLTGLGVSIPIPERKFLRGV